MDQPFLSVIIPAYNEEKRLPESIDQIVRFLQAQRYSSELLIVNDGSEDNTAGIVRQISKEMPIVRLLSLPHRGKGHAIKNGVLDAHGDFLFTCDADLSMPIHQLADFLPPNCRNVDIAIGSREAHGARRFNEPVYRHVMGRVFNTLVRMLVIRGIRDTQAGFKCFRREVAHEIFPYQTLDGWAFDVEVLLVAQKHGYRLKEIPIDWHYRSHSRVNPIKDTIEMLKELIYIRKNHLAGRYDLTESLKREIFV